VTQTLEFAMPIPLREDFDAADLRREAKKSKDSGQARRLLALAAIYDGSTRTQAAKIGGVTLQIVRDWVLKFNAHGPSGLIAGKAPGQTPRLTGEHRAALARMMEDGPIPAVHGVVRWRLVDLCQWAFEEYRVLVSVQTMSRELRTWAIASCRRGLAITRRRRTRSRILKKLPIAPGRDRAPEGR
jgi:transposase